jgi:metal-dependent amidase/aminoacylase/carboxypeptidase family protein
MYLVIWLYNPYVYVIMDVQHMQVLHHGKVIFIDIFIAFLTHLILGINALDAIVMAYQSIGLLRQQILPYQRIHGIITHGGAAPNIIPDFTEAQFYVRSRTHQEVVALVQRVEACFEAAAKATGCTCTIERGHLVKEVNTNLPLAKVWSEVVQSLGFHFASEDEQRHVPRGSTDMGNVTWHRPGCI